MEDYRSLAFVLVLAGVLVYLDARRIGAGRYKLGGVADSSPALWGIATALVAIVALPLYVFTRPRILAAYKAALATAPVSVGAAEVPDDRPVRICARCHTRYAAAFDGCPECERRKARHRLGWAFITMLLLGCLLVSCLAS